MRYTTWIALSIWLVSLILALITGRDLLYNTFYFMTLALVGSWLWAKQNLRGLEIKRRVRTPRSQVGRFVEETIEVANQSWLSKLWVEIRDESDLSGHRASRVLISLGRRQTRIWTVKTLALRRGRYRLGPITLRSGDPLGIFELRKPIPGEKPVLIYPAAYDIPGFRLPPGHLPGGKIAHYRTHYLTTNVATVRDYVPGDSYNRIHWPSTARTGRLMVKEFELDPTSDVWLLLDLDSAWHVSQPWEPLDLTDIPAIVRNRFRRDGPALIPATIEYAAAAAASIAQRYLAERRAVGLIAYTPRREVLHLDRGYRQFTKLLEMLALVEPNAALAFDRMLLAERHYLTRTSTVVVITPSADAAWVDVLRDYRHSGIGVTAVLVAASTFGPLPSYRPVLGELIASQIPTYLVRRDAHITAALSHVALPND
ncbi:MAG TPA: DUF58 domain-containing protein [Anaerolineae bacterium]|nr:DUF58 domain-containing protein [Caldilineae bacterium]HID35220.1 DUF58 domain-containing protein [Anaerolineae bacterium]HIQ11645.1 DUF58 domain-containing protein [Caldilineales bacterium]